MEQWSRCARRQCQSAAETATFVWWHCRFLVSLAEGIEWSTFDSRASICERVQKKGRKKKKIRRSGVSGWMKCALDADEASLDSSTEPKRTKGAMAGVASRHVFLGVCGACCEPHGGVLTVGVGRLNLIKIRASGSERTEQGHVGGQWATMKKRNI